MTFPFESLLGELRQVGLFVGALVGFGFGFVLERAGFGRAPKLAAQFYLYDMTVFKVMFGAIVTAMLGLVVASGLGLVDLVALSEGAISSTYIWPMAIGGFVLGAGFIISGYCPGTSLVSMSSGNLDGLVAILGVMTGTLLFGETFPWVEGFYLSGDLGHRFLYQVLDIPPAVLAAIVAAVAIAGFIGAEKVEAMMTRRIAVAASIVDESVRGAPRPKRLAFGVVGMVTVVAVVTLFWPVKPVAVARAPHATRMPPAALAALVVHEPWSLRILDVRATDACARERLPGAECVPAEKLPDLGLSYSPGTRALVIVGDAGLSTVPTVAETYPGQVALLEGGFEAWRAWALTPPAAPAADATAEELAAHRFRTAMNAALTGRPAAPPPPVSALPAAAPPKKKKAGGCSG